MSERTPSSDQEPSKPEDDAKPQNADAQDDAGDASDSSAEAMADETAALEKATPEAESVPETAEPEASAKGKPAGQQQSATAKAQPTPAAAQPAPKRGPHPLSWINLVLMLGLFAVAGYGAWLGWQQQQNTAAELAVVKDRLQQAQQQTDTLRQEERQLQQQTQQALDGLQQLGEQLQHNSERLAKLPGAERQDWLLAEAEYLMRLANQRLQLERDWSGALSMLQAADNVLLETRNPSLNPVRATLAKEMQALRAVPALDSVGAVYRLQSLQESLQDLPWLPEKLQRPQMSDAQPATAEEQVWYWQLWGNIKTALGNMVRIRQRDVAMEAPLTPDQFYYLQQNMHLMLEQAQVALLREEPSLYQHSLQRVEQWLDQYLMAEDERTRAVRTTLSELQQWQVAPAAPDISASLRQLQKLVEQQRRGTVAPLQSEAQEPAA
ncbi:heme biosynthesis operon protein HemX [Bacterioplanes sanyensis]|uniref:uroporphyrinogen-III C-methyltransferase n=1 Tax=Bacterioplanes sanyensis TaxID=1249553 RepID=UPI001673B23F|nr:uroporphyrinogen-III C-methyltransferase [Bacterioplanes sanyensis]GGY56126.1 heme biosynthesis operon protein HemX [Bacterioplanes sanyensis]